MRSFLLSMVSWTSDKLDSSAFIEGYLVDNADLILTINRTDLEQTMVVQIADGTAKVEGDTSVLGQLASTLVVLILVPVSFVILEELQALKSKAPA